MNTYFYQSSTQDGWANLAADEWLLDHLGPEDLILYLYINGNAVIIGRNQNPWRECDLAAMDRDGVQLVRRVSGGGAVYHDAGNLNFSFIAGEARYDVQRQLTMILNAVQALGIPCGFSGRNDLLSDGRKFSGNAYCSRGGICQHHGTLLIGSDLTRLQRYLQADPRKLRAKGVESVRSRVCNLSEQRPELTVPAMAAALERAFGETYGEYARWESGAAAAGIERYREKHSGWEWRLGKTPQFDLELDHRFAWGDVQLQLRLSEGRIAGLEVYSDALDAELPGRLRGLLEGARFGSQPMAEALRFSENEQVRELAAWLLEEGL